MKPARNESNIARGHAGHIGPDRGTPSATRGSVAECVRRIGFEIEDGDWRSWRQARGKPGREPYFRSLQDSDGVRPMGKHEVLHAGTGVRMEADEVDEDGMRLSDVEFVTDPFQLSHKGHAELMQALRQIERVYSAIAPLHGRDHVHGKFVSQDEHQLSHADVLLSRGGAGTRICVQATHGLSLADVPRFYTALGAPPTGRPGPAAAATVQGARTSSGGWPMERMLECLRLAPVRAQRLSLAYIEKAIGEEPKLEDSQALLGLLTVAIAFLGCTHARPMAGGIKTFLPVMHRNDFATMFALLPSSQRELLREHEQCFVQAVLAGLFGDPALGIGDLDLTGYARQPVVRSLALGPDERRALVGGAELPTALSLGKLGVRVISYRPLPRSMTIERWVRAWVSDREPADLMTVEHFDAMHVADGGDGGDGGGTSTTLEAIRRAPELAAVTELIDWSQSYEQGSYTVSLVFDWTRLSASQRAILSDSVRELGGLGSAVDSEHPSLVLFENRSFGLWSASPAGESRRKALTLSRENLTETISAYFSGMLALFGGSVSSG